MRKLLPLPLLFLVAACADSTVLQPAQAVPDGLMAMSQSVTPAHGGWEFTADANYVGSPTDGGVLRFTPGGILHWTDIANAYQLTGDLEGTWTSFGKAHINLKTGKGPTPGWFLFDLTKPGTGTFECQSSGMVQDYPSDHFTLGGKIYSCDGTGYFEGKKLKATWFNTPGTVVYHVAGVIW